MRDDKAIFEALVAKIKERFPDFEVRFKEERLLHRLLGAVLFFSSYSRMVTTLFGKVYYPSRAQLEANYKWGWKILAHEYVHLLDWDRGFVVAYLSPQIYALGALLSLGAFFHPVFLLALGFLVFLGPWPSKGRTRAELRGYAMGMAVTYWHHGSFGASPGRRFWGPGYYYMCRDRDYVNARLDDIKAKITNGLAIVVTHPTAVYDVYDVMLAHGAYLVRESANA